MKCLKKYCFIQDIALKKVELFNITLRDILSKKTSKHQTKRKNKFLFR